jgi:hypothetical protein
VTRLFDPAQPVSVQVGANGSPALIVWNGHRLQVQSIVQRWRVDTGWWEPEGEVRRAYYAAIVKGSAAEMLITLYHDEIAGDWRVAKVYD